jgi:arylsulfatase A-like enzyme
MSTLHRSILVFFVLLIGIPTASMAANVPPNLIVIMADDLSSVHMGLYGNREAPTPNLNRLAREGAWFRTCWATPICSPSRAQIMTGRFGTRTGWYHNGMKPKGPLASKHLTIGEVFRDNGYATAVVGKWQVPGTQDEHGFDENYMWLGGHNLCKALLPHFDGLVEKAGAGLPGRPARYWHPAIVHDGKLVKTGPDDYGPELFVDFICDFMTRNKDRPFFVYFPMCLPHESWDFERNQHGYLPCPEVDSAGRRTGNKTQPTLTANVRYIDHMVGRITAQIDELGLRNRTVVMFTTDNGTQGHPSEEKSYGKNQLDSERGPRVPLVVNGPGIVKPLGECTELVQFADILPTCADLAGLQIPADNPLDGVSFAGLLRGEASYQPREWIFSYHRYSRWIRNREFLLDANGDLWDCGDSRDERTYKRADPRTDPAAKVALARFQDVLQGLPAPKAGHKKKRRK